MPNQNSNTNSSRIEGFNKILILLDKQKVEEEVDKKKNDKENANEISLLHRVNSDDIMLNKKLKIKNIQKNSCLLNRQFKCKIKLNKICMNLF